MTIVSRAPDAPSVSGTRRVTLWALRIVMAVVFVAGGAMKLGGTHAMVALFDTVGIGQWLRFAVGGCELVGGLLLLVPRAAGAAALGLIAVVIAAGMTQVVFLRQPPLMPLACFLVLAIIAWAERDATRRLLGGGKE